MKACLSNYISKFFVRYKSIKIVFCLILTIVSLHLFYIYISLDEDDIIGSIHKNNLKAVQLLTGRFSANDWNTLIPQLGEFPFRNCPEKRCYAFKPFYFRQKPLESSDAVLVHVPNLLYMPSKSSYTRNRHQLWIFMTMESQRRSLCSTYYSVEDMDDWFNITSTFKRSSTHLYDYKGFNSFEGLKRDPNYLRIYENLMKDEIPTNMAYFAKQIDKKPKDGALALWFVSHCETASRREDLTKELLNYIHIDIFGGCDSKFGQSHKDQDPCKLITDPKLQDDCNAELYDNYKFYLAFENSLCDDYITEKYWKIYQFERFFRINLIPIVRGPKREHYEKVSIKKSFIYADDFKTAKDLADYMNYLNENTTAYLEYFEWKLEFYQSYQEILANKKRAEIEAEYKPNLFGDIFCEICYKLHDKNYLNKDNGIIKISEYFNPAKDCWDKTGKPFLDQFVRFFGYCI